MQIQETTMVKCINCGAKQFKDYIYKGNAIPDKEGLKAIREPNPTTDTSDSSEQEIRMVKNKSSNKKRSIEPDNTQEAPALAKKIE